MEAAPPSKQAIAKGKRNMEETTASTAAQEASSKSNDQEVGVGEPSGKEMTTTLKQEGKERVPKSMQEIQESMRKAFESDDTDTDTDEDEETVTARWNKGLAAELGNFGIILVLVETNTGFAIFMYDGIKLLQKDALENIWLDFANDTVAKRTAWLLEFRAFDPKASAINSDGVSEELAGMIRHHIEPGQKLAVGNKVYQQVIQNSMEISCLCGATVEELMWGLKFQMPYLLPLEESMLDEKDCLPMSKGMKQLLKSHSFILEPEDMKVPRHVINLAAVVRQCDRCVNKHDYSLCSAAEHLKRISHIDTQGWDLLKLATALKMICYPEEKIAAAPRLFSKHILAKLKKDAPKYKDKIMKAPLLIMYKEMYLARRTRSNAIGKLSRCLEQRERIQEAIVQLTECNESLSSECNKRQNPPTLVPADVLLGYTCISSHQLHRTNEPGILSMHIHPSKDIVATGGIDTNAVLFDLPSDQILCTLTGHSEKITTLNFVNGDELLVTGSADKTVRIWHESDYGNYSCRYVFKDHTAEVAAVTVQAGEKYFVSASKDNSWCLYDISAASCVLKVGEASARGGYTSASFHPRGLLLGTGTTTAVVKIWDMKTKSNVANLKGHVGPVTAISFSGNGYLLATAALDGVRLWDVRKLEKSVSTISPYNSGTATNVVEFDSSGSYLGIGGSDARVYQADKAECNIIKILPDLSETGKVTSLKFGADTKYIAVGSMDNLRIFGLPGDEQMQV